MPIVPIVKSCRYRHPEIGPVNVRVVASSRAIRARWIGQEVQITIPPRLPASEFEDFIARSRPRLMSMRPGAFYSRGTVIDCGECDFAIEAGAEDQAYDVVPRILTGDGTLRGRQANYLALVRPSLFSSVYGAELQTAINKAVIDLAAVATRRFVLPRARQLADRIDRRPLGWDVRHNRSRLGSCSSKGIITLGARLIFLPPDLRDYVIWHELAHLSEMNHSPRFHALVNEYCRGREAELQERIREFRFPVFP
ncbi:MAG: M48 family metallopeptidase [Muribaculaceae bacterium]|nr:M48 family metallopeptidase [Muribaculaceae bacterium]